MDATTFMLNQQLRRLTSEASSARGRVLNAQSMTEVVRHASLHIPPTLRAMRHQLSPLRSLTAAVERRLNALLDMQLERLGALDLPEAEQQVNAYYRGGMAVFARHVGPVYRKAEFESQRLLRKKREASSAGEQGAHDATV